MFIIDAFNNKLKKTQLIDMRSFLQFVTAFVKHPYNEIFIIYFVNFGNKLFVIISHGVAYRLDLSWYTYCPQ